MSKKADKLVVVQEITVAAKLYKQNLVGKKFLYVFDNRYIEVIYKVANFKHLTGVATSLPAKQFFDLAVRGKLQVSQISFDTRHPYNTCKKKMKHLKNIAALASAESFMLEEVTTQTEVYKFGSTDLNFSLCFNKEYDQNGKVKGDCFVVQSLRDEDCFSKSKNVFEVTHIFSKDNTRKLYTTCLYSDENISKQMLSADIRNLLVDELKAK